MSMLDDLINLFSLEEIHRNLNETEDFIEQKATEVDSVIKSVGDKPAKPKSRVDAGWITRTAIKKIKIKLRRL